MSTEGKQHYKDLARAHNNENKLSARRKITGFWVLAHTLMKEMSKRELCGLFIFEMFDKMQDEVVLSFNNLNNSTVTFRRRFFISIVEDEAPFLL